PVQAVGPLPAYQGLACREFDGTFERVVEIHELERIAQHLEEMFDGQPTRLAIAKLQQLEPQPAQFAEHLVIAAIENALLEIARIPPQRTQIGSGLFAREK